MNSKRGYKRAQIKPEPNRTPFLDRKMKSKGRTRGAWGRRKRDQIKRETNKTQCADCKVDSLCDKCYKPTEMWALW